MTLYKNILLEFAENYDYIKQNNKYPKNYKLLTSKRIILVSIYFIDIKKNS